jgi:hypothetical protein
VTYKEFDFGHLDFTFAVRLRVQVSRFSIPAAFLHGSMVHDGSGHAGRPHRTAQRCRGVTMCRPWCTGEGRAAALCVVPTAAAGLRFSQHRQRQRQRQRQWQQQQQQQRQRQHSNSGSGGNAGSASSSARSGNSAGSSSKERVSSDAVCAYAVDLHLRGGTPQFWRDSEASQFLSGRQVLAVLRLYLQVCRFGRLCECACRIL